jgi:hypothetical protein
MIKYVNKQRFMMMWTKLYSNFLSFFGSYLTEHFCFDNKNLIDKIEYFLDPSNKHCSCPPFLYFFATNFIFKKNHCIKSYEFGHIFINKCFNVLIGCRQTWIGIDASCQMHLLPHLAYFGISA